MVVSHGMDPTFLQPLLASVYTRMIRSDPNPRYTLCLGTNIMAVNSSSMLNLQRVMSTVSFPGFHVPYRDVVHRLNSVMGDKVLCHIAGEMGHTLDVSRMPQCVIQLFKSKQGTK